MRRLVIRPGGIGDTIVSLPALEHLCHGEPGVEAEIWAPARNLPLVAHLAPVRSLAEVQLDLLEIDPPARLIERLRSFDEVVSWYGAARPEFRTSLEAAGVRARLLTAIPPQGTGCHAVDFYLQQVGAETGGGGRKSRGFQSGAGIGLRRELSPSTPSVEIPVRTGRRDCFARSRSSLRQRPGWAWNGARVPKRSSTRRTGSRPWRVSKSG